MASSLKAYKININEMFKWLYKFQQEGFTHFNIEIINIGLVKVSPYTEDTNKDIKPLEEKDIVV